MCNLIRLLLVVLAVLSRTKSIAHLFKLLCCHLLDEPDDIKVDESRAEDGAKGGDKAGAGAGAKAGDEASFDAYFDFEATDFSADSEDLADNKDVKAGTEDYDALLNEKINIAKASYENLSKDAKELKKT